MPDNKEFRSVGSTVLASNEKYRVVLEKWDGTRGSGNPRYNPSKPPFGHLKMAGPGLTNNYDEGPPFHIDRHKVAKSISEDGGVYCSINRYATLWDRDRHDPIVDLDISGFAFVSGYIYATGDDVRKEYAEMLADARNPQVRQMVVQRFIQDLQNLREYGNLKSYALVAQEKRSTRNNDTIHPVEEWDDMKDGYQGPYYGDGWKTKEAIEQLPVEVRGIGPLIPRNTPRPHIMQPYVQKSVEMIEVWLKNPKYAATANNHDGPQHHVQNLVRDWHEKGIKSTQWLLIMTIAEQIEEHGPDISPREFTTEKQMINARKRMDAILRQFDTSSQSENDKLNAQIIFAAQKELRRLDPVSPILSPTQPQR